MTIGLPYRAKVYSILAIQISWFRDSSIYKKDPKTEKRLKFQSN